MKPKVYKLLKDMPNCKAGALWSKYPHNDTYNSNFLMKADSLLPERVENNPEWFEEVKEKSWEIVSFQNVLTKTLYSLMGIRYKANKHEDGFPLHYMLHEDDCVDSGHWAIHSVKRLSDSAVFSVGDTIRANHNILMIGEKITSFKLIDDLISVHCDTDRIGINLDYITKVEPIIQKSVSGGKTCFQVFNNSNETIVIHGIGEYINKGQSEATISSLKLKISMLEREVKELETGHHCHTASEIQGLYTKIEKLTGELKDAKNVSSRIKYMTDSIFNNDLAKENKELKEEIRELNSLMRKADDHFVSCLASDKFSMKSLITFRKYFEKL